MNILKVKRQQFVDELTKLAVIREAKINEKVAAYRASLEAETDSKIVALKSSIEAIDTLIATTGDAFEYEVIDDEAEDEDWSEMTEVAQTVEETPVKEDVPQEVETNVPDCFKRKDVNSARPGMTTISIPTRH